MKSILIRVPDPIKVLLDAKRAEGYSLNGFINAVLEHELAPHRSLIQHRSRKRINERVPPKLWNKEI